LYLSESIVVPRDNTHELIKLEVPVSAVVGWQLQKKGRKSKERGLEPILKDRKP